MKKIMNDFFGKIGLGLSLERIEELGDTVLFIYHIKHIGELAAIIDSLKYSLIFKDILGDITSSIGSATFDPENSSMIVNLYFITLSISKRDFEDLEKEYKLDTIESYLNVLQNELRQDYSDIFENN